MKRILAAAVSVFPAVALAVTVPAPPPATFTPQAFRAHVAFLADDLLEGRDIGSRGHEIAARYVAERFAAMGLQPAGDPDGPTGASRTNGSAGASWLQRIPFQITGLLSPRSTLTVTGPAGTQSFAQGGDVLMRPSPLHAAETVSGGLVFVGYGLESRALGLDDYAGLDVTGKIVVVLSGYPPGLPNEPAAHIASAGVKRETAAAHGAIAMIAVQTHADMVRAPFLASVMYATTPTYSWIGKDGQPFVEGGGMRANLTADDKAAAALFAGAPVPLAEILKQADRPGVSPRGFALAPSVTITQDAAVARITSPNVVAILPGTDPALKSQYVVLSAHLDHLGISPARPGDPPDADRINNGALDNASGVATMLEVARAMSEAAVKPRRSVVFLASTGEEKGLLGADYYATNPTVPKAAIVGNVDLDMPLLLYHFTDVIAFGADHSTLGPIVAAAVAPMGITLSADPMPQESIFTRSDHYRFVRQGVPAVFLATGYANGGAAKWHDFLATTYHRPNDDMSQPIDWASAARFAEANYRITEAMANADQPPLWNQDDFFGDLFAPDAPKAGAGK